MCCGEYPYLTLLFCLKLVGRVIEPDSVIKGGGAALFVASLLGFYLLIVQLFGSMGFPFGLPVGDLSRVWEPSLRK